MNGEATPSPFLKTREETGSSYLTVWQSFHRQEGFSLQDTEQSIILSLSIKPRPLRLPQPEPSHLPRIENLHLQGLYGWQSRKYLLFDRNNSAKSYGNNDVYLVRGGKYVVRYGFSKQKMKSLGGLTTRRQLAAFSWILVPPIIRLLWVGNGCALRTSKQRTEIKHM